MGRVALRIGWTLVRVIWIAAMIAAPLFGFWLASSLAAFNNASPWLALLVGLLLFPIVPVGWELLASWRRSKRATLRPPVLTRLDRLVLRTLLINGLFLGGMMYFARDVAFRAIALRGDWLLDGHDGPVATALRDALLGLADRFEHRKTSDQFGTSDKPPPPPVPVPDNKPAGPDVPAGPRALWPLSDAPDPAVVTMPSDAQLSITTVGAYLKEHFPDRTQRIKAIHDFVVLRLSYDKATLDKLVANPYDHDVPSQDAEAVFEHRTGVCEGYARLMVALGKAADVDIAYVVGYIRDARRRVAEGTDESVKAALEGYRHAWNAVQVDGQYQLLDATWDDPVGGAPGEVRSTYLFTPPRLFALDHLPEDSAWQLLPAPLSPGDFARQPLMSPDSGRLGVTLVEPTRSQVTVDGEVTLTLDNPGAAELMAQVHGRDCDTVTLAKRSTVHCRFASSGEYEVQLFGASAAAARGAGYRLDYIGSVLVNSR